MRLSFFSPVVRFCAVLILVAFMPLPALSAASGETEDKPANRVPGPMVLPQAWPGGDTFPAALFAIMNHVSLAHYKPYRYSSRHTMSVNTPVGPMKVGPKSGEQFVDVLKLRYGITDRLEVRTATPFINLDINNYNANGSWKGGMGDTTMMLRYGLKKRTEDSPFSVALDLGLTLPTGEVGDKDKYLATNAFSLIMGGGFSWADYNQRVDFDGRYAAYAEGAHGIKPGDFALFHGHYAFALSRNVDIGAEAYYRIEQQSEIDGKGQRDAYSEAYIGPKIQIKIPELSYLMIGAAVLFPAYRHYDGTRFSTDTRWEFSTLVAF